MHSHKRPNILARLWLGFWRGLTAFRMAVFNILFLLVLALLLRLVFVSGDGLVIEDDTTLVIEPVGEVVEEYTGTPVERMVDEALGQEIPETRLRDITAALARAATDERISQVLVRTDELWGLGPGMMQELAAAFDGFRQSDKPIIAYGGFMAQGQYFLASLADEIWLDADGLVLLQGYGRYRQYYREGLEKLAVDVNLFRVGEYKSAVEPFIRDDMSEEDRAASEYFLGALWQAWLEQVALNRGMPVEVLSDLIDNVDSHVADYGGDLAALALDRGLVDRLVSRPELRAELASRGASDGRSGFRKVAMRPYLADDLALPAGGDRVGIIVARGAITEGEQPPGTIGAESTSERIRKAARDDSIQAVVLRIDSGGGSAYASEIIRREMVALDEIGKPVVVSMGNVAASGGYWIAMGADEIWAYPTTITGSIGIFGLFPTFQDTLARIGIHTDGVGTTPLAGALRPDRELPQPARNLLQRFIEHGYEQFINLVAEHRQISPEEVDAVARGRVWSGAQAQQRGLIDHLGTLDQAIAAAARIAGLGDDYGVDYVEPELGAFQRFIADLGVRALTSAGLEPDSMLSSWLPREMRDTLLADLGRVMESTRAGRAGVMAHCLCLAPQ